MGADGRLHASFEYPNTAAALLAAGLAVYARRRFLAYSLAAGAAYTLSVAFVLSASRGAVLVLPAAVAVAVAGLPAGRRLPAFLLFAGPLVAAAATARGFIANGALGDWPRALKWFSTGAIGSVAGGLALAALLSIPPGPRRWLAGTAAVAAALLAMGAVTRAGGPDALVRRYLPPHAARLLHMNWRTPNALLRLYYYRDAARMLLDRPWLGGGGRAWERLYHQYQSFWYAASETHNHFLQTAVETGVPGLLASLSLWVALPRTGWKASRPADPPGAAGPPVWPAVGATWAIGLHSAMDFDLSYLSMVLLVWALAGLVSGAAVRPQVLAAPADAPPTEGVGPAPGAALLPPRRLRAAPRARSATPLAAAAVGVAVLAVAAPLAASAFLVKAGWDRLEAGAAGPAITLFGRAARLAPLDPEPHVGLARAYRGQRQHIEHLSMAEARDPHWFLWPEEKATVHLARQEWEDAARSAGRTLQLAPIRGELYPIALGANAEAAIARQLAGDREGAAQFARRTTELAGDLLRHRQASEPVKHLWPGAQPPLSPVADLRYGQALALQGRPAEAVAYLERGARSPAHRIQAEVWLYLAAEAAGRREMMTRLQLRPWVQAIDGNPVRNVLGGSEPQQGPADRSPAS